MATKLHLGINLSFARLRWPQPSGWLWVVNKLQLKYVEFCSDLLDPILVSEPSLSEIAAKTKKEAEKEGITIFDYYTGVIPRSTNMLADARPGIRADALRWCEGALKVAKMLGAKAVGGHFDYIPYRNLMRQREKIFLMQNLLKSYQHLSQIAKKEGLDFIMVEQMYNPSEKPYTITEAEEFYKQVNEDSAVPYFMTVNVGHACSYNYPHEERDLDPYEWLRKFAHISPVIHIQQTTAKETSHRPFTKLYNQVGLITPEKVIAAIEESGSKENYLMLEIYFPLTVNEKQIMADLQETVNYWRKYITD